MKYHIWTVGCQMNVADSHKLAAGFDRAGLDAVDTPDDADLVVLNTCSVREHAEDRAIGMLGKLKKQQSKGRDFKVAVMGCMVGPRHDDLARRFPYVDAFARPQEFSPIMALAGVEDTGGEFWPTTFATPDAVTAFVPVVHGCDKFFRQQCGQLRGGVRLRGRPRLQPRLRPPGAGVDRSVQGVPELQGAAIHRYALALFSSNSPERAGRADIRTCAGVEG